ncbi:uncharacterized protein [Parasteatoda tepidariorum]|uniref:uncharacterized protein n=1 Tax=Parasteatoda tepidariorum TaxID=114398 RepID=UPI00077FC2CC|nr:uncharacterized protein LOC107436254 [Parasteatoda tepidariorum]
MYLIVFILSTINVVIGEQCTQLSNCICKFTNGSVIDLTSLGYQNEARFKRIGRKNSYFKFYYNPCFPFTLGGACIDVSVCQVGPSSSNNEAENWDCGNSNNEFIWNTTHKTFTLVYTAHSQHPRRKTIVNLKCDEEAITPILEFEKELPETMVYEMTLTSRCACPDLCQVSDLCYVAPKSASPVSTSPVSVSPVSASPVLPYQFVLHICVIMSLTMILELIFHN